jgi:hypothetical protein
MSDAPAGQTGEGVVYSVRVRPKTMRRL